MTRFSFSSRKIKGQHRNSRFAAFSYFIFQTIPRKTIHERWTNRNKTEKKTITEARMKRRIWTWTNLPFFYLSTFCLTQETNVGWSPVILLSLESLLLTSSWKYGKAKLNKRNDESYRIYRIQSDNWKSDNWKVKLLRFALVCGLCVVNRLSIQWIVIFTFFIFFFHWLTCFCSW